ncbi:MAG: lipopolysaccharide transport periplasmic protein LptA [Burkholderiaceae bacterium]
MKNLIIYFVCLLVIIWAPARSIDKPDNQRLPLQIDANSIQHNDARAVTKFLGNVVLIRGDLTLKGDSLILNQTEDGLSFGKVMGSPAVFQTRRTVEDGWVTGEASELDYDERNSTFLLKGNARLVRLENGKIKEEVSGDELSYNSDSEVYKAITEPGETRTRMTVIPKPSDE